MNTIEKIKAEAAKAKVVISNNEKRSSIAKQFIPVFRGLISRKYGNIELLNFEYGKLPARLVTACAGETLAVDVRKDPGLSFASMTLRAEWNYYDNTTRFNVGTDRSRSFLTPEEAVDNFVKELTSWYSVDKASLVAFAESIPEEDWFNIKCNSCGSTDEFYATEHINQRVLIDDDFVIQRGIEPHKYEFKDVVCVNCGSTDIKVKTYVQ